MSRRIISLLLAALTIFALLPASAAFAQANATARLTSNQVVFPGDHTYSIEVSNTEPQLIGRTINAVSIQLPTAAANIVFRGKPPAAGSFTTVKAVTSGYTSIVTWTGGSLAPQSTQVFQVPVTVKRPARSDVAGDWLVQVSSNNMTSASAAKAPEGQTLRSQVEALEILPNSVRPTAPTNADNSKGVTDRTGTAGQSITYAFDVKNHATEAVNVTGALSANNASDRPGAAVTKSVAGAGGVSSFSVPVALGEAATQRSTVLTASAVAPNADALTKTDTFTVQVPVDLAFTGLLPTRVRSGLGSAREFTVTAAKSGGPGFDMTSSALRFGTNSANIKTSPVRFDAGARTASLAYQISEIAGGDGNLNASVVSAGTDDNLASYSLNRAAGVITIDNIVPTFNLNAPTLGEAGKDIDGDSLIAAANGTKISVSGKALGTDLVGNTLKVVLQPDVGPAINVPVTQTQQADGISFSGSVSGSAVNWDPNATRFVVAAEIADDATNVGTGQTSFTVIDTAKPILDRNSGVVTGPRTIRVEFDDATGLRGACDPTSWRIDGAAGRVVDVRTADGRICSGSANLAVARELSTDGVRVLTVNVELGPDDTPTVTYTPGVSESASRALGIYIGKDGAANGAAEQTISTVTDIVPPAPDVTNPQRKDHQSGAREAAYLDAEDGRYYTNVGGADAIQATVGGIRHTNYKIQVLDSIGNVIATYDANDKPATSPLASEWTQNVLIPLPTADGSYLRSVRLLSSVGKASPLTAIRFVIDTAKPSIGESTLSGPGEAFGYFNEKIVAGSNSNRDWFATWTLVSEGEARRVNTQVLDVQTVEGQNLTARRATFDGIDENSFIKLDYSLQNPSTVRYEDRAGNFMLDTITFDEVS